MNTIASRFQSAARPLRGPSRSVRPFAPAWRWTAPQLVAAALVTLVAFVLASSAAQQPNFNPDESRWLSRAHYLADLTDPLGANWTDRYMTRGQPPLGSYAMAAGLLAHGRDLRTNPPWDFARRWEVNVALGRKPVAADLEAGRRTSAVLVALTSLAIIVIARLFVAPPWATVAGGVYALHPFASYVGSIAMSDALFGLLIAASAVAAAALGQRPGWPRAMLVGVLLGLGGATKLSPLLLAPALAIAAFALLGFAWIRHRPEWFREARFAALSVIVVSVAAATFVGAYPYLWPDPVGRSRALFDFRTQEMAAQASDWPEMAVPTRIEALRRVAVNFGERYTISNIVARQLTGARAPRALRRIELLIPLFGIALMTAAAIRDGPFAPRSLALAMLAAQSAITVLGMRSEFDRYHLPMALLGAVAAAVALERLTAIAGALRAAWLARWSADQTAAPLAPARSAAHRYPGEGRL